MRAQRIKPQPKTNNTNFTKCDISLLNPVIEKFKSKKGSLIPLLQATQELFGYIPAEAFEKLAYETSHSLSKMYGVATFYAQFRLVPAGKHIIKVCHGTACHVQGAKTITNELQNLLKVNDGQTTPDGFFTIESVACLGCCSLAPVMMVSENTFGNLTAKETSKIIKRIKRKEANA